LPGGLVVNRIFGQNAGPHCRPRRPQRPWRANTIIVDDVQLRLRHAGVPTGKSASATGGPRLDWYQPQMASARSATWGGASVDHPPSRHGCKVQIQLPLVSSSATAVPKGTVSGGGCQTAAQPVQCLWMGINPPRWDAQPHS
jgi:hypothetical protein